MYATTINLFTLAMLQLRTHKRKTMGDKTLYINIPQQHDRYIISEIYFTTHRQLYNTS
jgi:hypothetical protein